MLDAGHPVRLVARSAQNLDTRAQIVEGDMSTARDIVAGASVVVSCAHARHTSAILGAIGEASPSIVLMGSAWRYSRVFEPRGKEVTDAEVAFLNSGRNGVMLHPTMIYGGRQENNISLLLGMIRRWPVLPMPGGGVNLVQPIHIEDVATSVVAAATRTWPGPHVFPISGPAPMRWRDMASICARAMGRRRYILPVPLGLSIWLLDAAKAAGLPLPVDRNVLLRFREDVNFTTNAMQSHLAVTPRAFERGVLDLVAQH